jgi:hypothetical protein
MTPTRRQEYEPVVGLSAESVRGRRLKWSLGAVEPPLCSARVVLGRFPKRAARTVTHDVVMQLFIFIGSVLLTSTVGLMYLAHIAMFARP